MTTKTIDRSTGISIGVVVIVVGLAFWVGGLDRDIKVNASQNAAQWGRLSAMTRMQQELKVELATIKGQLNEILRALSIAD